MPRGGSKNLLHIGVAVALIAFGPTLRRLTGAQDKAPVAHSLDDAEDPVLQYYSLPAGLETAVPFVQLQPDEAAYEFMDHARRNKPSRLSYLAFRLSKLLYNRYDAQAMFGLSAMHLISAEQLRSLLAAASAPSTFESVLDVGAGDGRVTSVALRPLLRRESSSLTCTETSSGMARRLAERNFTVLRRDVAESGASLGKYELAAFFNVLDRCDRPLSLVKSTIARLAGDGWVLLATPLPFHGKHFEGTKERAPAEQLPGVPDDMDWAGHVQWLLDEALPLTLRLRPVAFTRVPYMSMGDDKHEKFFLSDIVVLCRPA